MLSFIQTAKETIPNVGALVVGLLDGEDVCTDNGDGDFDGEAVVGAKIYTWFGHA
jgi:hypothetical protein